MSGNRILYLEVSLRDNWGTKYGNNMQTKENMTSKTAYFTPYLSGFYQYFSFAGRTY